jgi:uncharacterized protein YndB with AHSA1/START domain
MTVATPTDLLTLTRTINAPVAQVYQSFTNRDDICDWLCRDADIRAEEKGYLLLIWQDGNHAYGSFEVVEENKKLVFSWQGSHCPDLTKVKVLFEEQGENTIVTLHHKGINDEETRKRYQKDWDSSLNNLQSILETGANLGVTERVLIGILIGEFNEEIAKELGVPVSEGVRVATLIPDYSAADAGLQVNDVIVEAAGKTLGENHTIPVATQGKKPGDTLDVGFYRGSEKHTITVKLKGYPIPAIPADFNALADEVEAAYTKLDQRLTNVLAGVSAEDLKKPVPNVGGTVLESVANMVFGERANLEWLSSYTYPNGPRRTNMRGTPEKTQALIAVYPTADDLLKKLRSLRAEFIALLRNMPETMLERKNYLWWMTYEIDPSQRFANFFVDAIEAALKSE